jgi:hypothetical protein
MGKPKAAKEPLRVAAVLKMSFRLRGDEQSPAFKAVYPGVLRALALSDDEVEKYIAAHRELVERQARGHQPPPGGE